MHEARTLGALLRATAAAFPDNPFIVDDDGAWSYADVDRKTDALASSLLRLGVRRGDHVAIWLTNSPEWIVTLLAAARIGAAIVPINTRYKADEAAYIIAQSDARVLVMMPQLASIDFTQMLRQLIPDIADQNAADLKSKTFPQLKTILMTGHEDVPGTRNFNREMTAKPDLAQLHTAAAEVVPDDLMLICYTSGTTGRPKGVMHNHNVIRQCARVAETTHMDAHSRMIAEMPFYHVGGMFLALIPALAVGSAIYPMGIWDAGKAARLIESEKITTFGGSTAHYLDMMKLPDFARIDFSSLEGVWIGLCPAKTYDNIVEAFGLKRLLTSYGLTENTVSTNFNRWDDSPEDCRLGKARLLADCEVKIVSTDTGETLGPDRDGEIWCRGETVMLGYYKNPEATRDTITADGWLRTGDIGRFDRRGYLSVTSRIKEMFKIGGTNAYPAEIEQHLATHPDIEMALVVGAPDPRLEEVGFAFVKKRDGAALTGEQVIAHCKSAIADYKVPRYVDFVEAFPLTDSGKIARPPLVARAAELVRAQRTARLF